MSAWRSSTVALRLGRGADRARHRGTRRSTRGVTTTANHRGGGSSGELARRTTNAQVIDLGIHDGVELRGIEPLTYSMRTSRATNCATAPVARRPGGRDNLISRLTRPPHAGSRAPAPSSRSCSSSSSSSSTSAVPAGSGGGGVGRRRGRARLAVLGVDGRLGRRARGVPDVASFVVVVGASSPRSASSPSASSPSAVVPSSSPDPAAGWRSGRVGPSRRARGRRRRRTARARHPRGPAGADGLLHPHLAAQVDQVADEQRRRPPRAPTRARGTRHPPRPR